MKDQKNIERLFQEKFKDFEAIPPQGSWNAIASRLNEKKKKKRVVPFWFQLSGIAASLFIIGTLIWNFQSEENTSPFNNTNQTVVGVENENNDTEILNSNAGEGTLNTNTNNPNSSVEQITNTSESKNSTFDSKLINSKKTNTTVVSNEKQNIRSNVKNNNNNSSIISDTKKNKKLMS